MFLGIGYRSDVHIDLFHYSWFTQIHQNSCRFDSIQLIYDELPKGIQLTIHKSEEQQKVQLTIQLTYDSLHQIQLNTIQQKNKMQIIYVVFNLAKFYW